MGGLAVKKIAIMLATIIFIQLGATSVFADYTDVSGHWALRFINELTDKKIVEGDNLAFRPDSNVNVDEFIKNGYSRNGYRGYTSASKLVSTLY